VHFSLFVQQYLLLDRLTCLAVPKSTHALSIYSVFQQVFQVSSAIIKIYCQRPGISHDTTIIRWMRYKLIWSVCTTDLGSNPRAVIRNVAIINSVRSDLLVAWHLALRTIIMNVQMNTKKEGCLNRRAAEMSLFFWKSGTSGG